MRKIIGLIFLFIFGTAHGADSSKIQKYLLSLLEVNAGVHHAFIKNDENAFKTAWDKFSKGLKGVAPADIKASIDESNSAAGKLTAATKFDEKRKLYGDVVKPLVVLLQKYGPIAEYRVFTCPMVKKDWIQNIKVSSNVENPYEPNMVNCGMMRE